MKSAILVRNTAAIAFEHKYPITKYHSLVTPLRHVASFFDLGSYEYNTCLLLINQVKNLIIKKDSSVTGFNIGINDGMDEGQTIFHSHIHVIPRRNGDVTNPRGRIRNIIPSKGKY